MANYKYCVYCHTNRANGMKYIGRTHQNPLRRWRPDGSGYDGDNVFGRAIKEYGWENFSHEILAYGIEGVSKADEIERMYISQLNTLFPNGYNTEDGGIHGTSTPNKVKIRRGKTGWHHTEDTKRKLSEKLKVADTHPMRQRISKSKPVNMYSKDGAFIKSFYGASEASRETGIDISQIAKMCKDTSGKVKSAGGFVWRYKQ